MSPHPPLLERSRVASKRRTLLQVTSGSYMLIVVIVQPTEWLNCHLDILRSPRQRALIFLQFVLLSSKFFGPSSYFSCFVLKNPISSDFILLFFTHHNHIKKDWNLYFLFFRYGMIANHIRGTGMGGWWSLWLQRKWKVSSSATWRF